MSASIDIAAAWPSSDRYATRATRARLVLGIVALAVAILYAGTIAASGGELMLVAPLAVAVVVVLVIAHPVVGVYLLFGAALLFEQFPIAGLDPITAQSHIFQNVSAYTPLPLRLSIADLLLLLTAFGLIVRRLSARERLRLGPLGWGIAAYAAAFVLSGLIGVARGGMDLEVGLNELRAPFELCTAYFLTANLVRERSQVGVVLWTFVVIVGVKALQGILNYQDAPGWSAYDAGAVTGHEDVVFFGTAVALAIVMAVLGVRTKLFYVLLALQPVLLTALLLDQRRTGFIALAVVLVVVAVLLIFARPKRGLLLAAVAGVAALSYIGLFWDASGPLAEPVRAVRSVVDPSSVSARDQSSSAWRQIENRNIAFTIQHLPLTGVGLGEKYLVHVQPPPLYDFIYWQYITHNALLWLWLKAGPIAAFALWTVIARAPGGLRDLRERPRSPSALDSGAARRSGREPDPLLSRRPRAHLQPEHARARLGPRVIDVPRRPGDGRRGSSCDRDRRSGMSVLRTVARNVAMLTASRVATWIAAFAFTIAQARYLGPGHFGELSVALTYAALLAIVMDFGLGTQLSRMVAQRSPGHEQALAATIAIRAGLWFLAAPALLLVCAALGYGPELQLTIFLLAVSVLLVSGTCAFDVVPQQFVSNATRESITMLERTVDSLSIEKRMFFVPIVTITADALVPS